MKDFAAFPWGRITLIAALMGTGCGDATENVPASVCSSGVRWTGGSSGDARMHPGKDCVGCHEQSEGPPFALGGTVFSDRHGGDNCFGLAGVKVRITGADGKSLSFVTNEAGNFYLTADQRLARPYMASIFYDGVESRMATAQTDSNCASCHTRDGANLASGRISPNQLLGVPSAGRAAAFAPPAADAGVF